MQEVLHHVEHVVAAHEEVIELLQVVLVHVPTQQGLVGDVLENVRMRVVVVARKEMHRGLIGGA